VSSRRGLPDFRRMRHDKHFVEELANHSVIGVGQMVALDQIETNREQPRTTLGDLSELVASIRAHGVLEPLLVRRPKGQTSFELIAGERRFHAALEAGLSEVPCVELQVNDQEALEIALIENLQRKDLTPFEEAEGYRSLVERYGYTHDRVATALGRSRTTITESLKLLDIPPAIRDLCRHADIAAKSILLLIARAGSIDEMERLVEGVLEQNLDRESLRIAAANPANETQALGATTGEALDGQQPADAEPARESEQATGSPRFRAIQIRIKPDSGRWPVHLSLSIRRPGVTREQVIHTLETLLEQVRSGDLDERLK
jgi:ParB family transcriptional regulator, chromosome partitioning protein